MVAPEQPESSHATLLIEADGRERPGPARGQAERELERGDAVGRYVILGRVGAGGMGVVYAAWDPKLDRKVALKLLHDGQAEEDQRGQRLEREAQAMARLTHPNVIAVHDVGEVGGRVFMAMEFVEGETLGRWARLERGDDPAAAEPRPWADTLEVMLAAGRGLAAAHAEGLIHRDFKPDNVMIGADGRVRVMDFGLVTSAAPDDTRTGPRATVLGVEDLLASVSEGRSELLESALESQLTRVGSLLGTPAYMAPEQLHGQDADARSDQFAYCVALWQCLYGVRPFAGETPLAILFAITQAQLREPPPGRAVPTWLRRVIERGLAADPGQRWPDMPSLLAALANDPAGRRRPWLLGGASLAVAFAAAAAALLIERPSPPAPCERAGEELREVWSEPRRAALGQRFEASELVYADETWTRVDARLDAWARGWMAARAAACEDTEVRQTQSAELLDRRMACLDQRRDRFAALVELFAAADDTVIEKAVEAVEALPSLDPCADRAWLTATVRPPEDPRLAGEVAGLRERLAKVRAMTDAGKAGDAAALAEALAAEAEALAWDPIVAEAFAALGRVDHELGAFAEGEPALERAYFAARRSGHDELTIEAGTLVIYALSLGLGQFDRGAIWIDHVLAEARRIDRPELVAEVYSAIGIHHYMRGETREATEAFAEGLALEPGDNSVSLASAHINYGTILARVDPSERARAFAELELGTDMLEASLGAWHPSFAVALSNYATVHGSFHEHREAIALLDRALAIDEQVLGPEHPMTGLVELNLARNLSELGDDPEALARGAAMAERSLATHEAAFGDGHVMVAESERAVAVALLRLGRPREATAHAERAIAIWTASFGEAHVEARSAQLVLARCDRALGRTAEARALLERILGDEAGLEDAKLDAAARLELAELIAAEDPERAAILSGRAQTYFKDNGDDRSNQRIIALQRELDARG